MQSRVHYGETFTDEIFEILDPKKFMNCKFINCRFKEPNISGPDIKELIKNNTLSNCWYNPTLLFTDIILSLNDDINVIDFINRALIKGSDKAAKKLAGKQLVLFDIDNTEK